MGEKKIYGKIESCGGLIDGVHKKGSVLKYIIDICVYHVHISSFDIHQNHQINLKYSSFSEMSNDFYGKDHKCGAIGYVIS